MTYGIVLSKDVMVTMRDGIELATDLYRPGREGELVEGRYPTVVCITPYDKTERRYTEIADFFVPRGYAVVLQDMRDRHRSAGHQGVLPQRDAAHRARTATTRSSGSPPSRGATGAPGWSAARTPRSCRCAPRSSARRT